MVKERSRLSCERMLEVIQEVLGKKYRQQTCQGKPFSILFVGTEDVPMNVRADIKSENSGCEVTLRFTMYTRAMKDDFLARLKARINEEEKNT